MAYKSPATKFIETLHVLLADGSVHLLNYHDEPIPHKWRTVFPTAGNPNTTPCVGYADFKKAEVCLIPHVAYQTVSLRVKLPGVRILWKNMRTNNIIAVEPGTNQNTRPRTPQNGERFGHKQRLLVIPFARFFKTDARNSTIESSAKHQEIQIQQQKPLIELNYTPTPEAAVDVERIRALLTLSKDGINNVRNAMRLLLRMFPEAQSDTRWIAQKINDDIDTEFEAILTVIDMLPEA